MKADFVCPKCNGDIDINEHELYELYEEEGHYIEFPLCKSEIVVTAKAVYSFEANEPEE